MGKKPKSSIPPPSADSSSDEFDLTPPSKPAPDSDDDSDESESSSQEEPQPLPQNPNPLSVKAPPAKPATSSDSETDSGSDSDSDTPLPNSKPKPLASKPIDQTPKPVSNSAPSSKDKHALKRPAKTVNVLAIEPPKRAKKGIDGDGDEEMKDVKKSGGVGESNSKKLFQRLWSEEDEIAILKGMVEFTSKVGQDPYKHADAFYDFMKKSLHAEASGNQLKEKIRRLKLKFEKNALRGKNGEDPKFSKVFDRETFELSKKVWGGAASGDGKVVQTPKKGVRSTSIAALKSELNLEARSVDSNKNVTMDIVEFTDASATDTTSYLIDVIRVNGLSEDAVRRGTELLGESKRKELEGKWKELQAAELELSVKRVELIANHARLILEACKSSNQH